MAMTRVGWDRDCMGWSKGGDDTGGVGMTRVGWDRDCMGWSKGGDDTGGVG